MKNAQPLYAKFPTFRSRPRLSVSYFLSRYNAEFVKGGEPSHPNVSIDPLTTLSEIALVHVKPSVAFPAHLPFTIHETGSDGKCSPRVDEIRVRRDASFSCISAVGIET